MKGKVYLIGAGPGDLGLVTQKAVEILEIADTIVFDRLVNPDILEYAREDAKLIDVGKTPGGHLVPQEEINHILVREALEGNTVARLKGGDPFVFGRGGEEALYLHERDIIFEVIPGVTSSISVPAYAGIPVTHRGMASSFHVITGHEAPGKDNDAIDFEVMAKLKGTLVFLMGMKNLSYIASNLLKHGKPSDTPCSIIMRGATSSQKTVMGPLSDICSIAIGEGIKNPAIIVVGEVVSLRTKLRWYDKKELFGKRIMFTGIDAHRQCITHESSDAFRLLREKGAEVISCPTLKITPQLPRVEDFLDDIETYDIMVFTSKNGVGAFSKAMTNKKFDARKLRNIEIWAVGLRTAETLQRLSLYPDKMPQEYTAKAMAAMVTPEDRNKRVAVITSNLGGGEILRDLKNAGMHPQKITVYENTVNYRVKDRILNEMKKGIDLMIFSSPSTFYHLAEMLGDDMDKVRETKIAAIGPTTRDAIKSKGYQEDIMPKNHTFEGLALEIIDYYGLKEGDV
jgi:uroporphyrinogen III methyltransferase/synthase